MKTATVLAMLVAAAFLLDTVAPVFENVQADTAGPGGLDAPGDGC